MQLILDFYKTHVGLEQIRIKSQNFYYIVAEL